MINSTDIFFYLFLPSQRHQNHSSPKTNFEIHEKTSLFKPKKSNIINLQIQGDIIQLN